MQRAVAILLALVGTLALGCGGPQLKEHVADLGKHLPATLEAERPREGDPRTLKVRIYADAAVRALPRWKEDLTDQLDYASQLLTPLVGIRLSVDAIKPWERTGDFHDALRALSELDKGEGVAWVIGYVAPGDTAGKAMGELGDAQPLGHHVVLRAWADKPEIDALAGSLPDLKDAERTEVHGAHRRHKQTVVLLHALATTLGAIPETDPQWIQHPSYSPKQTSFSERNRELLQLAVDERLTDGADAAIAHKLLEAIEKSEWGGWIAPERELVVNRLRNVIDATKAGKTATDIPPAAYDQITRIKELAKRGDLTNALVELDNVTAAYPGNGALTQLKCDLLLASKAGATDPKTRAACARVTELAPGDPGPHLAVGAALVRAGDLAGGRAELLLAEGKIGNLPTAAAAEQAWRAVIGLYQGMGALTWTEDAIAKAKLDQDPVAVSVAQVRARYGVPRGTKLVAPEKEAALVAAVKKALEQIYASKYAEAEKTLAAGEAKWPNAPGLAAARCDLALRIGQLAGAKAACARALATFPEDSWALYLSGVIALKDPGATRLGIEQLKKAIAVDAELGQAWRTLAKAYARAKDKAALDQLSTDYLAKFGQPLPR